MKIQKKIRLDDLLVEKKLVETRSQAKALILAGEVQINHQRIDKAGSLVAPDAEVSIKQPLKYVGRGGLKLEKALIEFGVDVSGCVCVDVGASTGGFTDCLLQHDAKKVYAIDVGYGQMHWRLQNDDRVVRLDRENFRNFDVSRITEPVDLVVMDVSFISVKLLIPKVVNLLSSCRPSPTSRTCQKMIVLVKPQFEAGPEFVGKGGIVRDKEVQKRVVADVQQTLCQNGFTEIKTTESPLQGADGNREFLVVGRWD